MTLGVTNNGQFKEFATYVVIFVANLLYLLPRGVLPSYVDIYDCFVRSLFTTVVIWLANKGIQWRSGEK